MKNMMRVINETVWTIAHLDNKDDDDDLSESTIRIMESGFPDHWIVIEEDAYGKMKTKKMNAVQLTKRFGILPPLPQVPFSKEIKPISLQEILGLDKNEK